MRRAWLLPPLLWAWPLAAQVTTNDAALKALAPAAPAAAPAPAPASAPDAGADGQAAAAKPPVRHRTHAAKPAQKPPVMPDAPPANPVIAPPPLVMPPRDPPPPPAIPLRADAPGSVEKHGDVLRLLFGPGTADLNPGMLQAIQYVAAAMKADGKSTISVVAFAPGEANDPSTARRLSLSRALAVRAVLIHEGIMSDRIYARAQGFLGVGNLPADRADITLGK